MPETVTNEPINEVLKSIQAQIGIICEDVGDVKTRLTSLHSNFAALQASVDFSEIERVGI